MHAAPEQVDRFVGPTTNGVPRHLAPRPDQHQVMHVCFLCNEYPPGLHGGLGSKIQVLSRGLVARGHQVSVVGLYSPEREGVEDDMGVRVIRLPASSMRRTGLVVDGYRLRRELTRIHLQKRIDILEGSELSLATLPRSFPALRIIRLSGGHHFFAVTLGKQPRRVTGWLEKRSFSRADFVCGGSRFISETTRQLLQLGNQPIEVLPHPVDTNLFHPRLVVSEEPGLLVFVGTVCEKKGVRQLIQAMPQIIKSVPDAHLWVVGRDTKDPQTGGSYTERLRGLIDPSVGNHIAFKGPVEHSAVPNVLACAEVCVFPSHMEGLANVNLEGMALGKAIVIGETGPGPEIIEDEVSGFLCNPHDPVSIADKVIRLLKSRELRQDMGSRARQRAVSCFSQEVILKMNEAFFRRCLDKTHPKSDSAVQ